MKALHVLVIAGALVGTGLALAIGLRSGASTYLPFGFKEPETTIVQETIAQPTIAQETVAQETVAQAQRTTPPVTTASSAAGLALAKHLKSVGAKMYGAYWCPHCHEQLQVFGQKAATQLPYVECADNGKNARPDLCKAAGIEGYPTWKIKGKTYEGTQTLRDLANASSYKGARNF
ncbi:MAG: hypothetical protein H7Z11_04785 [Verrucomicrobia bacterium]|nr:hypothetical protein [Leptolyngbya sp. ES-bin-22]